MISLHRRRARAICAFPQGMLFQCLMTSSSFGRVFSLHRRRARAMFAFHGGMRCDDQTPNPEPLAPSLTQVPSKTSQSGTKMAPTLPKMVLSYTRVAPKSSQETPKMASTRTRMHILQHVTYKLHLISLARRNAR